MRRLLLAVAFVAASSSPAPAAEPRWTMVRTPSLTVIGDQSVNTLRDVATQIEQFRTVVAGLIRNADRPLSLPTIVFVVGDRKAAQPFLPLYNGKPLEGVGGYFQGGFDANVMLLSLEGFEESSQVVYHEFTHLLMRNAVRSMPVWLNEGLAEYYSGYKLEPGGKDASVGRPLAQHVLLLRERYMPLADLLAVDAKSPLYNEGSKRSIFYAESWALTHFAMTELPDGPSRVNRYSVAIAEGMAPNDAFREAFGKTPAEADKDLRAYVSRLKFNALRFSFGSKIAVPEIGPPRTLTAGEANAWLGDLQRRLGRQTEAADRIEKAAVTDPSAPVVHAALGLLRIAQHRGEEAIESLAKAAEMAPDDFLMEYLYGAWLLRVDRSESPGTAARAVVALTRATHINPSSADAFGWLAYALMLGDASLPEARAAIEKAAELAPGRIEYRLRWADIRILQGGYDDAKAILTKIAAVTFDADAADGATQRLDRLAKFQQAEAARQAARLEDAAAAARAAESRSADPSASSRRDSDVQFVLRKVRSDEERAFGMLIRIDCAPKEVKFHVRSGERTITTVAPKFEDVELTQFVNDKQFTIGCGSRTIPDTVYVTWRPDSSPVTGRAGIVVSIEFLPQGYVP